MSIRKLRISVLQAAFLPIIFLAVFTTPGWHSPEESFAEFLMELGGYLFLLFGLGIRVWCIFYIGGRKSRELITYGPYSLSRNPLYVGTFLLSIGIGLSFANLLLLLVVLVVMVPMHVITVLLEEKNLERRFGEEFRDYKRRVPRFLPRFSQYHSPEMLSVNVRSVRRIVFDTWGVLLLPWLEDWVELLREHGSLPALLHLPF